MENKGTNKIINDTNIECLNIVIIQHFNQNDRIYYKIEITFIDNSIIIANQRYSDLLNLHSLLSKEGKNLPRFPPKKYFGNTNESFLAQRQKELNLYFQSIVKNPEFKKLKSFQKWLINCLNIYNRNNKSNKNTNNKESNKIKVLTREEELKRGREIKNEYSEKYFKFNGDEEYSSLNQENIFSKYIQYNSIFIEDKIFEDSINDDYNIPIGNNNNFDLIGKESISIKSTEAEVKKKMESLIAKYKKIEEDIYYCNDILIEFKI